MNLSVQRAWSRYIRGCEVARDAATRLRSALVEEAVPRAWTRYIRGCEAARDAATELRFELVERSRFVPQAWSRYIRGCDVARDTATRLRSELAVGFGRLAGSRAMAPLLAEVILASVFGAWLILENGVLDGGVSAGAANPVVMFKNPNNASLWLCNEPAPACQGVGQGELTINEEIANVPSDVHVGSFQFLVYYDSDVVSVSVTEGPFLGSTGRHTDCWRNDGENWIRFGCTSTGAQQGPSGSGVLAYLTLTPNPELVIRPTVNNGVLVQIADDSGEAKLSDELGDPIQVDEVVSAAVLVRVLEGDLNYDCSVNVIDEQSVSWRYGSRLGIWPYHSFFDLEPYNPDFDIDIKDLQFVYGRDGDYCEEPPPGPSETPTATATATINATATPTATITNETATPAATFTPGGPTATPTMTETPAGPSATPTITSTPGGPTATPTSTHTPGGPTATPTTTWTPAASTPTPTATHRPGTPEATRTPRHHTATPTPVRSTCMPTSIPTEVTSTPTAGMTIAPPAATDTSTPQGGVAPAGKTPQSAEGLPTAGDASSSGGGLGGVFLAAIGLAVLGWCALARVLGIEGDIIPIKAKKIGDWRWLPGPLASIRLAIRRPLTDMILRIIAAFRGRKR